MGFGEPDDDAGGGVHGDGDPGGDRGSTLDRGAADFAFEERADGARLQSSGNLADGGDGAGDVSVHRSGVALGAGDGDAQRAGRVRDAGAGLVLFQHWLDGGRGGDRLLDGSDVGAAQFGGVFLGRGDRWGGAVGLPISGAAGGGLPVRGGFQMERFWRAADPETDGASGDRGLGDAGECGGERDVRLRGGRGRGELAELCLSADAITHRRLRRGGGDGDSARSLTGGDQRGGGRFRADALERTEAGDVPRVSRDGGLGGAGGADHQPAL